jgi:FlaA1/EpsC-like NDP-sugar epimerase
MRVVVTGSSGYIGSRLVARLCVDAHWVLPVDMNEDIMGDGCLRKIRKFKPDLIYHLAAHKYATRGETDPYQTAELNITGTHRIVKLGFPVVLASTCKAGDAITCYGASKLIAERIVLNAGGRVLRLVNVIGSTGSVAKIWDGLPKSEALPVTDCSRMWISIEDAVDRFIEVAELPAGKYIPAALRLSVSELAARLHPDRGQAIVPLRRGDRLHEPLCSEDELAVPVNDRLYRIENVWNDRALLHDRHPDHRALDATARY